ncbi:1,4-dihydroxy-2-naphthoate polyprenyltransferase [Haloarchaeobius sp. HME9146]|uniref:1,4-dihydroxy-2-naphthoate polyprenyltransferase n=1 Tax=Haloarchaeobius sp. HME9146 TaxID=2978732 RepID=UPI0021C08E69|nr:1,4-dihydroxy-2-naphthoate polyprenyltransferase [Haloarchaeobius sp. HME9146]MCT9096355.1 1,4-dihydroxy-2-naphthoate polyprenyltransferase [Haloarchaeobius sp. HME9146]
MTDTATADISKTKAWVMAARPQTLPAAAAPVIVGTAVAYYSGVFAALPAVMAFVGAALIQVGTNFANDYYDAKQGADTEERQGFTRVTQSGLIDADEVKRAMAVTFAVAIVTGSYLVWVGGIPILVVGLVSVASGVAYTGGPYPLGYNGLGDLFVFVFFGLVAVTGTYYVQAAAATPGYGPLATGLPPLPDLNLALLASLPIAAISTNILVVNNVRDREEDSRTGKTTLAVAFGYRFARAEFLAMLAIAYLTPVVLVLGFDTPATVLAPLLSLPLAATVTQTVLTRTDGATLNPALEQVGQLLALYALLFGIGFALPGLLGGVV